MSAERAHKKLPLLGVALQGLTQYAHLISVEYFSDLLAAMRQLLGSPRLPLDLRLRTLLTASDILK